MGVRYLLLKDKEYRALKQMEIFIRFFSQIEISECVGIKVSGYHTVINWPGTVISKKVIFFIFPYK